jgi:tetratricopeptide (TPR) repeat protein
VVPPDPEEVKKAVAEQLRERYDAHQPKPSQQQIDRYIAMAQHSRSQGEWASAINSLRVALSLIPDEPRVLSLMEQVQEDVDRAMADQFAEQARYEEADGHAARAARSYERAARGKSSAGLKDRAAPLYEHAAACLIAAGGDVKKVVELARASINHDARRSSGHVVLAQAYELAQMRSSALAELVRALELDPMNEQAKHLQKQWK